MVLKSNKQHTYNKHPHHKLTFLFKLQKKMFDYLTKLLKSKYIHQHIL